MEGRATRAVLVAVGGRRAGLPLPADRDDRHLRVRQVEHPELADQELHDPLVLRRVERPCGEIRPLAVGQGGRRRHRSGRSCSARRPRSACTGSASSGARRSRSSSSCRSPSRASSPVSPSARSSPSAASTSRSSRSSSVTRRSASSSSTTTSSPACDGPRAHSARRRWTSVPTGCRPSATSPCRRSPPRSSPEPCSPSLFPSTRSSSRPSRPGPRRHCRSGSSEPSASVSSLPEVNVVVTGVLLLTVIPVALAAKLTGGGGMTRSSVQ